MLVLISADIPYCLEQAAEAEGGAFLNFNLDSD